MRYSFVSALPAVLSLLSFSTAYSVPPQRPQEVLAGQSYSCPGAQSVSLCCSRRVKTNGGVDDCEKSLHFVIRAADDHSYLTNSVRTCSGDQVSRGYDRPVCCRSHFQPALMGSVNHGMNCAEGSVDDNNINWKYSLHQPGSTKQSTEDVPNLPLPVVPNGRGL
ncbi:unnamed protein product [Zymoseptoria tritici ST99CH_1A5]|uniref:Hydrophobin n=1 Tax=Zymoseptoria tritici ST99CH_1A5 TaxID=1276529 RepID=A0A1Y6LBL4_ZYMTR|nr:unnamed protein product [Zymoseptoria tritici ST99CH_1A5]